jgi:hypothetical protein
MEQIEKEVAKLKIIIPDLIFAEDEVSLEEEIGRLLKLRINIITAESCTGGNIAKDDHLNTR